MENIYKKIHEIPEEYQLKDKDFIYKKDHWYEFFFASAEGDPRRLSICTKTGTIFGGSFIDDNDTTPLRLYLNNKKVDNVTGWSAAKTASVEWHSVVAQREITIEEYPELFI